MFTKSADLYDLLYSHKNYQEESAILNQLIKTEAPQARTVLDICCGTAEHHLYLSTDYTIEGLDINPDFIRIAQEKNPDIAYHTADMIDFNLQKKYDVILCLFSSIGYVKSMDNLISTLTCFNHHLHTGGLVILEPWLTPEMWSDGKVHMLNYSDDRVKACRMNRSESVDNISILDFHYVVGTPETGVSYFNEKHELALFTREEMTTAFSEAGFSIGYRQHQVSERGLYVAVKK